MMKKNPLFDHQRVSMTLGFDLDDRHHTEEATRAMQSISVSGVQEKFPAVIEDMATLIGRSEADGGKTFKYNGSYMEIARCIRRYIPTWMVDMERFFELVVFNYIHANGDAHLKNFSVMLTDGDYHLAPAYDLLNTALHVNDADFALDGGLSPDLPRSDHYARTGHPCREDFETFGQLIGLVGIRVQRILDKYMAIPNATTQLVTTSQLNEKMQRLYLRVVNERVTRFARN